MHIWTTSKAEKILRKDVGTHRHIIRSCNKTSETHNAGPDLIGFPVRHCTLQRILAVQLASQSVPLLPTIQTPLQAKESTYEACLINENIIKDLYSTKKFCTKSGKESLIQEIFGTEGSIQEGITQIAPLAVPDISILLADYNLRYKILLL